MICLSGLFMLPRSIFITSATKYSSSYPNNCQVTVVFGFESKISV